MLYMKRKLLSQGPMDEADDEAKRAAAAAEAAKKAAEDEAAKKAAEDAKAKGGQKPSDKEAELLKEVMEKKNALKAANDNLAQVREQLKAFEGIDPAKVRELLAKEAKAEEERKQAEQDRLKAEGNWDALKKQMNEAHAKELKVKNDEIATLKTSEMTLHGTIADLTVGNAFGNSRFIVDELTLTPGKTRALFGAHFEYKDGKVIGYNKPVGAKDRAMLVDGQGEPLVFEEAIKKIVEADPDADRLVKSKLKAGAGSTTTTTTGKPAETKPVLVGRDKIAAGLRGESKQAA